MMDKKDSLPFGLLTKSRQLPGFFCSDHQIFPLCHPHDALYLATRHGLVFRNSG